MMKPTFFAKAKGKTGDLYIYEDIGSGWFGGIGPNDVKEALDEVGSVDTLNIYINSPGGSVFDGMAIYNQLKRFAARKVVHIDGIAASIASVIAMAGDEIVCAPNAMMMIHDPFGIAAGTAKEMRDMADAMDKVGETIRDTYVSRTKQAASDIENWMHAETWMKADEAKARGFVDRITDEDAQPVDASTFTLLAKFKNTPKALLQGAKSPSAMLARMEMRLTRNTSASAAK